MTTLKSNTETRDVSGWFRRWKASSFLYSARKRPSAL